MDAKTENRLLEFLYKVYNKMAHPLPVEQCNIDNWIEMCGTPVLRKQIALMGCDAVTAEEWYQKYGHDTYLTREEMFIFFVKLKTNPTHDTTPRMVGKPKASPQAIELLMHASRGGRFSGLLPG